MEIRGVFGSLKGKNMEVFGSLSQIKLECCPGCHAAPLQGTMRTPWGNSQ